MPEVTKLNGAQALRRLNKGELAQFFEVSPQAVDGWIRRGCPYVEKGRPGQPWVFDALDVAKWRFGEQTESQALIDPDLLPPTDRKAWYESEAKRRELQRSDRELIPASEVEHCVARAFSTLAQGLRSVPDNIERRTGCAPELIEAIELALESEMSAIADLLSELTPMPEDPLSEEKEPV